MLRVWLDSAIEGYTGTAWISEGRDQHIRKRRHVLFNNVRIKHYNIMVKHMIILLSHIKV